MLCAYRPSEASPGLLGGINYSPGISSVSSLILLFRLANSGLGFDVMQRRMVVQIDVAFLC